MTSVQQRQRVAAAHRRAVEATPADMARYLQDALGQRLVAYIASVAPRTVARWVNEDSAMSPSGLERISAAYQIFRLINDNGDSSYVVRAWFAGLNPLLDDESPATLIREKRYREVMAAARTFVTNG